MLSCLPGVDFGQIVNETTSLLVKNERSSAGNMASKAGSEFKPHLPLNEILDSACRQNDLGSDFKQRLSLLWKTDPLILSSQRDFYSKSAAIDILEAQKGFSSWSNALWRY